MSRAWSGLLTGGLLFWSRTVSQILNLVEQNADRAQLHKTSKTWHNTLLGYINLLLELYASLPDHLISYGVFILTFILTIHSVPGRKYFPFFLTCLRCSMPSEVCWQTAQLLSRRDGSSWAVLYDTYHSLRLDCCLLVTGCKLGCQVWRRPLTVIIADLVWLDSCSSSSWHYSAHKHSAEGGVRHSCHLPFLALCVILKDCHLFVIVLLSWVCGRAG